MAEAPIPGLILKMAIPTIVAFLINSIYSLTDTYFVHFLGTNATAAVSVNASLDQLIMMAGSMLAVGAASYSSRLLGARDGEKASQVLSTSFFGAFSFGLVVGVLGLLFTRPLVYLLGATPTCEEFAIQYADYVLLVAPFMACNFVMNQCLRAEGSALFSMFGMGFGGILNCVLDPIFIFQFDMGVAGASLATAISKLVSFAILIFPYLTRRSVLHLSVRNVRVVKDILYQVVSVGSSSMFRSGLAVVSAIILNNIAGDISDSVLAGVGVSTKIMMFPFGIILGFGTGFQPVAGFNWGAKRYDRVRESFRFATKASIAIGLAIGVTLALGADWVIALFAETDPEMVAVGALCVRLQCLVMPIHGWVAVANMFCAGLGEARGALILSSARQGTCFIPVVYPLAWAFGATGVASVQAVADVLSLVLAIPIIRRVLGKVKRAEEALAAESAAAGGLQPSK